MEIHDRNEHCISYKNSDIIPKSHDCSLVKRLDPKERNGSIYCQCVGRLMRVMCGKRDALFKHPESTKKNPEIFIRVHYLLHIIAMFHTLTHLWQSAL